LFRLAYYYRLLPSRRQHAALAALCESRRQLHNAALEERVGCYRAAGKTRTCIGQSKALMLYRRDLTGVAVGRSSLEPVGGLAIASAALNPSALGVTSIP
jgi:putative transposase